MEIMGITGDNTPALVPACDPKVTEVGVVIVVESYPGFPRCHCARDHRGAFAIVRQKHRANEWSFYCQQYPIFTNGDTYRRLSLNPNGDLNPGGYPSNLCNVLFEDATCFWLGIEDGEAIKAAVIEKFGDL
jgi:hypothetical protein